MRPLVRQSSTKRTKLKPLSRALLKRFQRLHIRGAVAKAGWGALATLPGVALAGPSGESVVAGSVDVSRSQPNRTVISQASQNAIVNWNTFSVDGNEFVLIQQPNSSAAILNRVIGSQQSTILGQVQANGRVFLVNPQGVYVGPGASIDVGALTLSALDIDNDDFMAGNYVFAGDGNANGSITNEGAINIDNGGFVVLAGDYVNNTGVITATLGTVVLAAGEQLTLDIDNDGLVGYAVDEATISELAGVENSGEIIADGGRVVMTASVANELVATAVNNQGLIRAHRIEERGGEVFLRGDGGDVIHGGTIDVAGENGGPAGHATLYATDDVTLEADSKIIATSTGENGGGTVRVIADGRLDFRRDASIDAEGAGFIELSGHSGLNIRGVANVGPGGEILIDPSIMTIQNDSSNPQSSSEGSYGGTCPTSACVGKGFIESRLESGSKVTLVADQEIRSSGGPFTISATTGSEGPSVGDFEIKIGTVTGVSGGPDCGSFGVCLNTFGFTPDASGDVNLSDVSVNIISDFLVSAGTAVGDVNIGSVRAGNVHVTAGATSGNINIGQTIGIAGTTGGMSSSLTGGGGGNLGVAAASTDLSLQALGGNVTVNGNLQLTGTSFTDIDIDADTSTGNIVINGNVISTATSGDANIHLDGANINISGTTRASGGTAALVDANATNNINAGAIVSRTTTGSATIVASANNDVTVGSITAEGAAGRVFLHGDNVTVNGATNVTGTSSALFNLFADERFTLNGVTNLGEAGGGIAQALFHGNGLGIINGAVNINAGPGGMARASFGGSEGGALNNLIINQSVTVNGAAGDAIDISVRNSARTNGSALLSADGIQVFTIGANPTIDIDTNTPQIYVGGTGGAPNVTVNNSAFGGPTSITFGGDKVFRSATFLSTNNLNFQSGFQADNLLVGAPNGVVNFQGPVFITGNSPFAPTLPDIELINIMSTRGLTPPGHGPNVQILGGNGINMTNPFVLGGSNPFIKLFSNRGFNTPGLTTIADNVLAVFNPINLASPILFGDTPVPPPLGALGFFNSSNIQGLPDTGGTTVVIGEKGLAIPFLSGPVLIGPDAIDLGDRNMFIISRGQVSGEDLVSTNGIFEIIGLAATANFFELPIVQELDDVDNEAEDEEEDEFVDADGDGNDGGEGTISEESNAESMECTA